MTEHQDKATAWFRTLRDQICAEFETLEREAPESLYGPNPGAFEFEPWSRKNNGGGGTGGGYYRPGTPLREMVDAAERDLLLRSLEENGGHMTRTAQELGLERSHLYKKLKGHGIKRGDGSASE